ncbi:MAG: hypothetical protein IKA38_01460, partial [Alistipes sp.]|nr:hypothetical protein [Alistipes sp.]
MKNIPIFRFLALLPLMALMMGSGTISEPKAEIYPLDGMGALVYYVADKPLSEGDTCELAV